VLGLGLVLGLDLGVRVRVRVMQSSPPRIFIKARTMLLITLQRLCYWYLLLLHLERSILTVSPLNPSGYMRIRGSTETLICMDPLNWHRLNFIVTAGDFEP
jgi:hypothetical protein